MAKRMADIPKDSALSVKPGSTCYVGYATAMRIGDEDVIIICRTKAKLKAAFRSVHPTADFTLDLCHKAVMLSADDVDLDDEL